MSGSPPAVTDSSPSSAFRRAHSQSQQSRSQLRAARSPVWACSSPPAAVADGSPSPAVKIRSHLVADGLRSPALRSACSQSQLSGTRSRGWRQTAHWDIGREASQCSRRDSSPSPGERHPQHSHRGTASQVSIKDAIAESQPSSTHALESGQVALVARSLPPAAVTDGLPSPPFGSALAIGSELRDWLPRPASSKPSGKLPRPSSPMPSGKRPKQSCFKKTSGEPPWSSSAAPIGKLSKPSSAEPSGKLPRPVERVTEWQAAKALECRYKRRPRGKLP
jgi:hypothetical protein